MIDLRDIVLGTYSTVLSSSSSYISASSFDFHFFLSIFLSVCFLISIGNTNRLCPKGLNLCVYLSDFIVYVF